MAYIKAEDLIKKIFPCDVVDKKCYSINAKAVYVAINETPAADVVPREEVEKLAQEKDNLIKNYAECMKDYAREIFAEIDKRIASLEYRANTPRKTVKVEELKAQCDWILHEVIPNTLAELKKKYIGDKR